MNHSIKMLGFTEEVTVCGCCGRTGLKGTYYFEDGQYVGSECAKRYGVDAKVELKNIKNAQIKEAVQLAQIAWNKNKSNYEAYKQEIKKIQGTHPMAALKIFNILL